MPYFMVVSGPYGYILALLALVVALLAGRGLILLGSRRTPPDGASKEALDGLLFWGVVAATLGLLGQCHGAYQAVGAILEATEISPAVVREGFVISFMPTLMGLSILAFAVIAWAGLRLLQRGRRGRTLSALVVAALAGSATGCSGPALVGDLPALDDGVWVLDAGRDSFLWDFTASGEGWTCMVHDIQGSVKLNETPCRSASLEGDVVQVSMDSGVRLEATRRAGPARLQGRLIYPDGGGMDAAMAWHPRTDFPPLEARAAALGAYSYTPPAQRDDGWTVADASSVGVDPEGLVAMVTALAAGEAGVIHSLVVARRGRLILEEYFHGYGAQDTHALASCTKSVSSLLVGLAVDDGAIPGVDTPILDFFPNDREAAGSGWASLTLEDLLTMSLALDWPPEQAENLHGTGPDFFRQVLARSVAGTPGQDFAYVSANVNLLAGVIRQATGQQADVYAERRLFGPLDIGDWDWDGLKTDGYNLMDGSLRLLPRDMAKLGQLVLDDGRWRGAPVVSEAWIRASTAPRLPAGERGERYGYLWWRMEVPGPSGAPLQAIVANGWGSQFIMAFPALDLVVVTTGGNDYNGKHMAVAAPLATHLLPAVDGPTA